ncbi:hypothetical protein LBMAG56_04450 [Verrucomicrobiota bacterium]|nr:hypothetical protein LBMAG56_04450 [Verrucomicrobiota bacterium]
MKQTTKTALAVTTTALAVLAGQPTAHAQSADTLIDKLVEKGVLTTKEAKDLRQEADNDFSKAYAAKTGMPDWVTSMKLGGDLRLRYDGIYIDNPNTTASDRNRLRYRLRFGPTFNLFDNVEVGIRLGSGENKNGANPFGDPISGNDSYTQNGGKKPLWIDHAYVKWTAINTPTWGLSLAGGKMESPFQLSDVLFDPDYTPEGFAAQLSYQVNDNHLLKFNNGFFALSEISSSSKDSYLLGTQLRWDAAWSKQFSTSLGLSLLTISDPEQLATVAAVTGTPGNQTVPNVNQGNLRAGTTGTPRSSFNPYVIDAAASYTLESFPFYPGQFPIRVFGDYVNNPGANSIRDSAYMAGIAFGKSGKKGTWDLSYRWKRLEGDYWFEELADSDHGAYYAPPSTAPTATVPSRTSGAGYGAGVNIQGHWMRAAYSVTDYLTVSATYYLFKLIDTAPGAANPDTGRLQIDASFKF